MSKSDLINNDIISIEEFTKSKGLSKVSIIRQARKGKYRSAIRNGKYWDIDKNDTGV